MHPVSYTPMAENYFKKLKDRHLKSIYKKAIINIRINPEFGEAKTGDLKGIYCLNIYHNQTKYEIAYRISKQNIGTIIVIIMAGTRENFYKELKRYIK